MRRIGPVRGSASESSEQPFDPKFEMERGISLQAPWRGEADGGEILVAPQVIAEAAIRSEVPLGGEKDVPALPSPMKPIEKRIQRRCRTPLGRIRMVNRGRDADPERDAGKIAGWHVRQL